MAMAMHVKHWHQIMLISIVTVSQIKFTLKCFLNSLLYFIDPLVIINERQYLVWFIFINYYSNLKQCFSFTHKNFALLRILIIYTFCGASSNSPGPVKNRTGLVKKKL